MLYIAHYENFSELYELSLFCAFLNQCQTSHVWGTWGSHCKFELITNHAICIVYTTNKIWKCPTPLYQLPKYHKWTMPRMCTEFFGVLQQEWAIDVLKISLSSVKWITRENKGKLPNTTPGQSLRVPKNKTDSVRDYIKIKIRNTIYEMKENGQNVTLYQIQFHGIIKYRKQAATPKQLYFHPFY